MRTCFLRKQNGLFVYEIMLQMCLACKAGILGFKSPLPDFSYQPDFDICSFGSIFAQALEKLKRQLAEAEAALEARKKPPEDTGPRIVGEGLVIDEWVSHSIQYIDLV